MVTEGLDSISAKLILQEAYETLYGIFNHDDPSVAKTRPLALVALHPKENTAEYGKLYRMIDRYVINDVKGKFGLSLTEFLNLPHDIVDRVLKVCQEQVKKENPGIERMVKELERANREK